MVNLLSELEISTKLEYKNDKDKLCVVGVDNESANNTVNVIMKEMNKQALFEGKTFQKDDYIDIINQILIVKDYRIFRAVNEIINESNKIKNEKLKIQ